MVQLIRIILICLLFLSLYFGSNQMGTHNDVFASAMARCCNNGICHNAPCGDTSSVEYCGNTGYMTTCLGCMNVITVLQGCNGYAGTWPTWCIDSNGNRNYAVELE